MNMTGTEYLLSTVLKAVKIDIKTGNESNLVPTISGMPGMGKSTSIKATAGELNLADMVISLGALSMEAYSGLPDFETITFRDNYSTVARLNAGMDVEEDPNRVRYAKWTMSEIIQQINSAAEAVIEDGKDGILVLLDDLHLVDSYIQKYLIEFFQNKTLQNFRIHEKAVLICAMNNDSDSGFDGLLTPLISRMAIYNAKFDHEHWMKIIGNQLHPYIASFFQGGSNADLLTSSVQHRTKKTPDARAWTQLNATILALEEEFGALNYDEINNLLGMMAASRVGDEAASQFMIATKLFQNFNFGKIFEDLDSNFDINSIMHPDRGTTAELLCGYMVRYITKKEHAVFLVDVIMKQGMDKTLFISSLGQEIASLTTAIAQNGRNYNKDMKDVGDYLTEVLSEYSTYPENSWQFRMNKLLETSLFDMMGLDI